MDPVSRAVRRPLTYSKSRCCVKSCKSLITLHPAIGYHKFPKENLTFIQTKNERGVIEQIDRAKAWKIALGISDVTTSLRVCTMHFTKNDFCSRSRTSFRKKKFLKKTAVPTVMVPHDFFKLYRINDPGMLTQRLKQENTAYAGNVIKEEVEFVSVKIEPLDEMLVEPSDQMLADGATTFPIIENTFSIGTSQKEGLPVAYSNTNKVKTFKNTAVQVDCVDFGPKILDYISNDAELNTMTGIPSFKLLDAIVKSVRKQSGDKYEGALSDMKTRDRVIITCTRMKHNLPYSFLTIMFKNYNENMSDIYCRDICQNIIKIFYNCYLEASTEEAVFVTLRNLKLENYRNLFDA